MGEDPNREAFVKGQMAWLRAQGRVEPKKKKKGSYYGPQKVTKKTKAKKTKANKKAPLLEVTVVGIVLTNGLRQLMIDCPRCEKSFNVGSLQGHLSLVHGIQRTLRYKCGICEMPFPGKKGLRTHWFNVHPIPGQPQASDRAEIVEGGSGAARRKKRKKTTAARRPKTRRLELRGRSYYRKKQGWVDTTGASVPIKLRAELEALVSQQGKQKRATKA